MLSHTDLTSEVLGGTLEAMSRSAPNLSRASTPQPKIKPPSPLQSILASLPGDSSRKQTPPDSPPGSIAPRKPSPLQNLLASLPNDPSPTKSPAVSSPVSPSLFSLEPRFPSTPQHLILPSQSGPRHFYPGQPQYHAQPLFHVPPRSHHHQLYQQYQTSQVSSSISPPYHPRPPPQFPQQQHTLHQYSYVPPQYHTQPSPQSAPQLVSERERRFIQSDYALQMAGNNKPAVVAKPATSVNKGVKPAAVKSKPKAIASAQAKPAVSKAKPATQVKAKALPKITSKAAPKAAHKSAPEPKITGEQHKKVARFDWLLRTFLNALNAIYDEFGGIPDQIKIVDDGMGRHHAQAVVEGYTGEVEDEESFVDPTPQLDVNKTLIDNSWDESKRLRGPNIPEPVPDSVRLMTSEYSNQGLRPQPPQYTMNADGEVQLADPVYQKPEHILQILGHLQNSPLGFTSGLPAPATPNISVKDGNVTLDPAQWDIVKDCLTVVHYMSDYSHIGQVDMYQEARASWIRMFGWAPGIDEMIQAKQRAHEFREQEGLHINTLGTRVWITEEKSARERRDCAVHRPGVEQEATEAPANVPVSQALLNRPVSVNAENNVTPAYKLASKPADSAVDKAELVILKAAIDANGKAFIPARTVKVQILPSMAAHTLICYPPRHASPVPSLSSRKPEVIELSDDEDKGDVDPMSTMRSPAPATSTYSQKSFSSVKQGAFAQEEEHRQHNGFNSTTSELMGPLIPARDPVLYPGSTSEKNGRKRKASFSSSSSPSGTSKRQAKGFGAHPEADGDADGLVALGVTGMGFFPGVAADVREYMRWEQERNRLKKEKSEARLKAVESWGVGQKDVAMNFS